ncbi:hypothetical protein BH20VER1_BH20VER1_09000 [soil metagenome]
MKHFLQALAFAGGLAMCVANAPAAECVAASSCCSGSSAEGTEAAGCGGAGCSCGCAAQSGSAGPAGVSRALNISTRAKIETGDNVLIAGFIITGTGSKRVIVRAVGPSLPLANALADPTLDLHSSTGLIASNDNWGSAQREEIIATSLAPAQESEAAIVRVLEPGAYTAIVRGSGGGTGVGLVEVFDLDSAGAPVRLANISARGRVALGHDVMIGGFILGEGNKRVILRARGPSLSFEGAYLAERLMDPAMTLHDSTGQMVASNDSWRGPQETEISASALAPTDAREPAIIATLAAGAYTFVVRGANETSGIALVELYDLDQAPQIDGSTLYVATLRGAAGVVTGGSGTATLRLSGDETSAILAFDFTNLSGPVTAMHIHASDGTILFDPDEVQREADGTFRWTIRAVAHYSVADVLELLRTGAVYFNIHTANHPGGEITGFFHYAAGAQSPPSPTPPPPLPSGPPTAQDASRFLDQATFGSTSSASAELQNNGFDAYLNAQFNTPPSYHLPHIDASGVSPPGNTQLYAAWWTRVIAAPDQLRQRVAFALSEIFVVSSAGAGLNNEPVALATYFDVLVRHAFGNFRDLLEDVTLNPAMGVFLDMLRSGKADPSRNTIPNENYARELLQLFSTGVYRLNLDGSLTLDAQGLPISTYTQETILGLSATFTGWHFAQPGTPRWFGVPPNFREPMMNVPAFHETAAKTILDGVVIPANQTAAQDLDLALDTIFHHPNVGPFICRQLIQRLVTSNPSPGYVHRVASVFNNNGAGVRGDLRAVVRAILMDYDARGAVRTEQGYGHLREPIVRVTHLLRAFSASTPTGTFTITGAGNLGQTPLRSPTVFNFFSPDYQAPGPIAAARLKSPEFEITTETTVVTIANFLRTAINAGIGPVENRTTLDLTYERSIAGNPAQLVDHLDRLLMNGAMSAAMRAIVVGAVEQTAASNPTERVRTAIYLIVNSPEYVIQR